MSIISTLAGLLLPGLAAAREKGRRTACINNLYQIGLALRMYADDYDEYIPTNWPANVPGDGYTGQSTNQLRVLPDMELGIGKLMRGYYLGQVADIFGCPSHVPFMPGVVKNAWAATGSVEGAYLWRETAASPAPGALCRLNVRSRQPYAIVMDNSTIPGLPEGSAHKWEWTNILFSDGRVAGSFNDDGCVKKVTTLPSPNLALPVGPGNDPTQLISYNCRFTHDDTPEAMAQVWLNADNEAYK
jgi:hypothetical protein